MKLTKKILYPMVLYSIAIFILIGITRNINAENILKLNSLEWKYSAQDETRASYQNFNDRQWSSFASNTRLYETQGHFLWLRSSFYIDNSNTQLALVLDQVCGKHQVYINGQLLKQNSSKKEGRSRCWQHAIHIIPNHLLKNYGNENIIAIRVINNSLLNPAIKGEISVLELGQAQWNLWKNYLWGLIFAFLSMVIAIIFIVIFKHLYRMPEYLLFSIFLLTYAVYKFSQNEIIYTIFLKHAFYERIAQFCFILLPPLFYYFHILFFKTKRLQIRLGSLNINTDAVLVAKKYLLISITIGLASIISLSITKFFKVNIIWLALQSPLFIYFIYNAIKKTRTSLYQTSFFLFGVSLLIITLLYNLVKIGEGTFWDPKGGAGIFLLELSVSLDLLYVFMQRKIELEKRNKYIESVNDMQHRIFDYIGFLFVTPASKIITKITEFKKEKNKATKSQNALELSKDIKEIRVNLDTLIELSRLEVMSSPDNVDKINVYDIINSGLTEISARAKLSISTRIKPDTIIENSPDLMISSIINLISFLNEQYFDNIDLILSSIPRKNEIIFRFTAFNRNKVKLQEIYNMCRYGQDFNDLRWLKWSVIIESIRVMQGKSTLKKINGRFFRISVSLPYKMNQDNDERKNDKDEENEKPISLVYTNLEQAKISPAKTYNKKDTAKIKLAEKNLANNWHSNNSGPKLRSKAEVESTLSLKYYANMSLGEIIQKLRNKWTMKNKS